MNSELFNPPRTFAGISPETAPFASSNVVVVPVPYDSTVEYRSGARDGPQAIIDASQYLELYDIELNTDISQVGIFTYPALLPVMSGPEHMIKNLQHVAEDLLDKGKFIVMLGGEHSLTIAIVGALAKRFPGLSVLSLDAHADLRDIYQGTRYGHASTMRRVGELCPVIQAGVRSLSAEEHEYIVEHDISPFYAKEAASPGFNDGIISGLSDRVYVSVDLDVFDPGLMPAVGTPEPGGLNWSQGLGLLRQVGRARRIIGFDVVELSPREGPNSCAYIAAKLVYKLIGYSLIQTG